MSACMSSMSFSSLARSASRSDIMRCISVLSRSSAALSMCRVVLSLSSIPTCEGRHKATWKRKFKLPWREAGPPNHLNDKVDSDQYVVNKEHSLPTCRTPDFVKPTFVKPPFVKKPFQTSRYWSLARLASCIRRSTRGENGAYFKTWIVKFLPVTDTLSNCNGIALSNRLFTPEKGSHVGLAIIWL